VEAAGSEVLQRNAEHLGERAGELLDAGQRVLELTAATAVLASGERIQERVGQADVHQPGPALDPHEQRGVPAKESLSHRMKTVTT